jgi:membrane-bound metal-dependent hydrolase YbcI (DUF457 family)
MSPVTHLFLSWAIANAPGLARRDRALVTLAGVAPDLDALGAIPELLTRDTAHPLLWFSEYHRVLTHNLLFGVLLTGAAFLTATRRFEAALLALLTFHLHLVCALAGARGPDGQLWTVPYLLPFTERWQWAWEGQWALNAWPNLLITLLALAATFFLAWRRGFSPLEMVSTAADRAFVGALRRRFPRPK